MTTQRRWRAWLNNHLLDRWLRHGRYYQLNLISGDHKNPEYRIADDVRMATDAPVDFAAGVLDAVLLAATFIGVLWAVGGSLTIRAGRLVHHHTRLPGDRGGALHGDRERLDDFHRSALRQRRREKEPGGSGVPLCADAAARERREHRGAGRRGRGAPRHRRLDHRRAAAAGATSASRPCVPRSCRRPAAISFPCCRSSCARPSFWTAA